MNIYKYDIVFQEVPNHISLAFYVCGCPLKCPGCHSPELWTEKSGTVLSEDFFGELLQRYHKKADCILFLGGEWHPQELVTFLKKARAEGYQTALYTGLDKVDESISAQLNYLKTGPWRQERGGLASPDTNQVFMNLTTQENLNHLFQH